MTDANRPSLSLPSTARGLSSSPAFGQPMKDMQQATRSRQNMSAFNGNLTKALSSTLNGLGQRSSAETPTRKSENKPAAATHHPQTQFSPSESAHQAGGTASQLDTAGHSARDQAIMSYVQQRDGEYLVNDGEFIRRGNTFIITAGEMKDYRIVYKGGRNFQIRNPDGDPLMIYHGPRRRPRIAAPA